MKRIISLLVVAMLLLTSLAGCTANKKSDAQLKEEIKKELEAEMAAKKSADAPTDKPAAPKVDMKNKDALYEFVKGNIKDIPRENFDTWKIYYFDITGDGTEEAVLVSEYGADWYEKMEIISGDSGKLSRIPSDIPLDQYGNTPDFKDGFLAVTAKTGGTGEQFEEMNLYIYNGGKIVQVLSGLVTNHVVEFPDTSFKETGKIDGKLTNFTYTLTKHDNSSGKDTIVKNELYQYNTNTKDFEIKSIPSPADSGNTSSPTGPVNASDLKVGDSIDGHTIKSIAYQEGDRFSIGLGGEYTVTGEISYDDEFFGGIILSVDNGSASQTAIKFMFDQEYTCNPPSGTFIFSDKEVKFLESKLGSSMISQIKNGKKLKVQAVIKDYSFSAKNYSSQGWAAQIIDVVSLEGGNGNQSSTGQAKTVNLADLKNGDSIGGGFTIRDIDYRKGDDRGSFTLAGTATVNGEFRFNAMSGNIGFKVYDSSIFPTIVIPGPNDPLFANRPLEYNADYVEFRNYDYVRSALSSDQLKEIENGKSVQAEITIKDIGFGFKFGSESGSGCELVKIN